MSEWIKNYAICLCFFITHFHPAHKHTHTSVYFHLYIYPRLRFKRQPKYNGLKSILKKHCSFYANRLPWDTSLVLIIKYYLSLSQKLSAWILNRLPHFFFLDCWFSIFLLLSCPLCIVSKLGLTIRVLLIMNLNFPKKLWYRHKVIQWMSPEISRWSLTFSKILLQKGFQPNMQSQS